MLNCEILEFQDFYPNSFFKQLLELKIIKLLNFLNLNLYKIKKVLIVMFGHLDVFYII